MLKLHQSYYDAVGHFRQINSLKLANEMRRNQFVTSELSPV